ILRRCAPTAILVAPAGVGHSPEPGSEEEPMSVPLIPPEPDVPHLTTGAGIPAPNDEHSLTVGPNGPILLHDHYLVQRMQAFNRERVPERVVHAKGGGAFGYFQITRDV